MARNQSIALVQRYVLCGDYDIRESYGRYKEDNDNIPTILKILLNSTAVQHVHKLRVIYHILDYVII